MSGRRPEITPEQRALYDRFYEDELRGRGGDYKRGYNAGYRRALHDVLHECKGHARRAAGTPHESGARWLLTVVRDMLRRARQ